MSKRRNKTKNFSESTDQMGLSKPSYMNKNDPYNTGTLPQDIPVSDPLFRVTSSKPYLPEIVTRKTVWDYFRVAVALPNPSKILQKLNQNIDAFDELLADARVKACLNNRRAGMLSLKWTIDQNNASPDFFNLVAEVFDNLDIYNFMSELALTPFYGYNVAEVNWVVENNLIIPESVMSKAARWFVYDDTNTLRYKTKIQQVLGEALPPRKFLVSRHHPRYDQPYGETLAEAVYWPVKFRHVIFQYAMQFLQKYGMPWLDITLDADLQEERLREVLDTIQNTYEDGIIAHPENTKITPIAIGDSKSIDSYTTMLDNVNREIDMAILGNNLNAEVKGGSFAAAREAGNIRQDIIDEDKRMVETTLNQLIEWMAYYNYNVTDDLPKFRLWKPEVATKERVDIDTALHNLGINFTKNYYQRVYQLNEEDFELIDPNNPNPADLGLGDGKAFMDDLLKVGKDIEDNDMNEDGEDDRSVVREMGVEAKDQTVNTKTKTAMRA